MKTLSPKFTWIPLGAGGGLLESDLSAHLIAPVGSHDFICLDAGCLLSGLKAACEAGCFHDIPIPEDTALSPEGYVLHHHINAYLITHPYLDHIQGLAAISPNDTPKPVLSMEGTINDIRSHLFNWRTWPNFGDTGEPPCLGQYRYLTLSPGVRKHIENTEMHVQAFPLSHGTHTDSNAFLIDSNGFYVLYMGDTGPDEIENRTTTRDLWEQITPLVREERLPPDPPRDLVRIRRLPGQHGENLLANAFHRIRIEPRCGKREAQQRHGLVPAAVQRLEAAADGIGAGGPHQRRHR